MKKILLSVALLSTMSFSSDFNYEVTPTVGYNFQEGNLNLDDALLYGLEFKYNGIDSILKPEFSIQASQNDIENSTTLESDIVRVAFNGVYEYDKVSSSITPLAKIGVGYETIDGTHNTKNSDGAFLNAGLGAKIDVLKNVALKLETVYTLKDGVEFTDNNFVALAGISYSFGPKSQPTPEPQPEPKQAPVDGDDDKDGVLNSIDECPNTPAGDKVDAKGCTIKELEKVVEQKLPACPPVINLHINFEFDSAKIKDESKPRVEEFSSFLKCNTAYSAQIIGHTDSKGSDAYNMKLSQKRADAVRNMVISKGVESNRISTLAKGESQPIATNETDAGRAENRRIEASLTKK